MSWTAPVLSGGCPVTSYTLLRDDGNGSNVNIVIDPVAVAIRPDPYSYTVTLNSTMTGKFINVKVMANNSMGSTTSRAAGFVLADVPSKPFPAPSVDTKLTSTT
jgi:hypothetical protein